MTAAAQPANEPRSLAAAIDAAPLSPLQIAAFVLAGVVMMIDGYDLVAMPFAVPHIVREWGLAPSAFSFALSAVLIGLGAGAILIAPLGDRFGRRPLILVAVVLVGLATLGTAAGTSPLEFAWWRFLTGVALGTGLANVPALVSEIAPKRRRAGILTLVSCGIALGGAGAGLLVPWLVELGGWQMIFIVPGAATLAIAAGLFLVLPESPKLLLAQGKPERAAHLARRFGLGETTGWQGSDAPTGGKVSMLAPLRPEHRLATFVYCGLYAVNALILYGLISWTPTLLEQAGFSLAQTSRLASLIQVGGLVTGPALSMFLDRGKARAALLGLYAIIGAALLSFSLVPPTLLGWSILLLIAGGGLSGTHLAIMALGATFYPPRMLSSALGFGPAVARIGAVGGPLLGGALLQAGFGPAAFLAAFVVPVSICIGGVLLIPAAQRRSNWN